MTTEKKTRGKQMVEATLRAYENYDLTGGGPPFGHVRTFHAELSFGGEAIGRNSTAGRDLVELVNKQGKPIGDRKSLPWRPDYFSGYEQKYLIPTHLTHKKIERQIPFKSVL
jgi:hypothetical protein